MWFPRTMFESTLPKSNEDTLQPDDIDIKDYKPPPDKIYSKFAKEILPYVDRCYLCSKGTRDVIYNREGAKGIVCCEFCYDHYLLGCNSCGGHHLTADNCSVGD